jgi:hypothetical protein
MIRDKTIPVWPEHVILREEEIEDQVLHIRHGINEVTREILKEVDGCRSVVEIADRLCERHGWPREQVVPDIKQLVLQLNERYLMNIRQPRSVKVWLHERWITLLVFMRVLQGANWQTRRRIDLGPDDGVGKTAIWRIGTAVVQAYGLLAVFLGVVTGFLFFALELGGWLHGLGIALLFLLGYLLHEWGHHVSFRKGANGRRPSFLAVKRMVLQIVRRRTTPADEWKITLAGPLLPTGIALLVAAAVWMGYWPGSDWFGWAVVTVMGVHLLSLIPPAEDGKRLVEAVRARRFLVKQEDG